jgi:glycerol-3-phosphate dehydrogenase
LIVLREEAEYLLRQLNLCLAKPLRVEQIGSEISGLRPLVTARDTHGTKELIRDHEVEIDTKSGLMSMPINAVRAAPGKTIAASLTREQTLAGAAGFTEEYWRTLAGEYALAERTAQHLAQKVGRRARNRTCWRSRGLRRSLAAPLVEAYRTFARRWSIRFEMKWRRRSKIYWLGAWGCNCLIGGNRSGPHLLWRTCLHKS